MKLLKTLPLVVLTGLFLLAGCSDNAASDDKVVLRLGHTLDTQHSVHKAMVFFGERLAVLSNGEMDVKIYPGSQLGTEREMIELLQIGSLSMTKVSASPLEGFAPAMKIFSIPYIFRDNDHYWTVLNSSVGKDLLTGVEDFKLKGLAYYDAGSRSFYTNDKPIHSPADLAGMKIRVLNSPTAVQTVRELGAAATPVSWGELYTAQTYKKPNAYPSSAHMGGARLAGCRFKIVLKNQPVRFSFHAHPTALASSPDEQLI